MIPLKSLTNDERYLGEVREHLPKFLDSAGAVKLAIYNAGTDIVSGDPIGPLDVSPAGVATRDRFVIDQLEARRIPTVIVTSGGYTELSHKLIAETALYLAGKAA